MNESIGKFFSHLIGRIIAIGLNYLFRAHLKLVNPTVRESEFDILSGVALLTLNPIDFYQIKTHIWDIESLSINKTTATISIYNILNEITSVNVDSVDVVISLNNLNQTQFFDLSSTLELEESQVFDTDTDTDTNTNDGVTMLS
jgi:hypothetical protein